MTTYTNCEFVAITTLVILYTKDIDKTPSFNQLHICIILHYNMYYFHFILQETC